MQWMGLNELREKFLSFFESKGHLRLKSFPLVPQGDKSLLLINAGMAPLKKYFLGQEEPPDSRVTTCQKCIRTPDIERVGKTARHGTFFEMLGNFSFGDYFKKEATAWAWEFMTKELQIPADRLWISIYEEDDEAFDIWTKQVCVSPDRIVRLGKEDNFWELGSGPCGPCSEIYFDRGEEKGCKSPGCAVGCDCDRFVEVWNLVFTQFDSDGNGNYAKMAKPNIDTGMGLERLACVMQDVDNLFEVDTVRNIMQHISLVTGKEYKKDEKTDVSLRVITDHIRSTVFLIADGVNPANDGRGYVLKRLLRRAARHGKLLGVDGPFLYQIVETVAKENQSAYPELMEKTDLIKKVVKTEEENFAKTIDKGTELLMQLIDKLSAKVIQNPILPGDQVFKLYDTYGFPVDLVKEMIAEHGLRIDEEGFTRLMDEQRERARSARLEGDTAGWKANASYDGVTSPATEFVGYDTFSCEATLLNLFVDDKPVNTANEGDTVLMVFDRTPFYAESGGQAGDKGVAVFGDNIVNIIDCKKLATGHFMHIGRVMLGSIKTGSSASLEIDSGKRRLIMKNHTCAHLLQKALRDTLGDHVHQAGQLVSSDRLRFDFNHFSAMTQHELADVEIRVNEKIMEMLPVYIYETDIDSAKKAGAMALFDEKYGDTVRVVDIEGYSVELCGGTHCSNTSEIGLFKIVSESSVAAGIRRIEAVTSIGVFTFLQAQAALINESLSAFKLTNPAELPKRCHAVAGELKETIKKNQVLSEKLAMAQMNDILEGASEVGGTKVVSIVFNGISSGGLRAMGDQIKGRGKDFVAVLGSIDDGKGTLLAVCGEDAVKKGAHAGNIVKEIAALAGGKGGGRPDSAMAGVPEIFKIDEAMTQLPSVVQKIMG